MTTKVCCRRAEGVQLKKGHFLLKEFLSCDYFMLVDENFILINYVTKYLYRTIIFPVVLYGCETWSLTLREEHRLRVFENRVCEENIWA